MKKRLLSLLSLMLIVCFALTGCAGGKENYSVKIAVLLPALIRACILGDEKDVDITGANDHVRVVAHISADEQFQQFMADLPNILEDIGSLEM